MPNCNMLDWNKANVGMIKMGGLIYLEILLTLKKLDYIDQDREPGQRVIYYAYSIQTPTAMI